ncbi:hypothetical protein BDZ88DRAFT_200481 [Geranomyces variabilis]|nr:hypothetical protein BDZ88DRAFT_200481 [Geranomyces variabilis]
MCSLSPSCSSSLLLPALATSSSSSSTSSSSESSPFAASTSSSSSRLRIRRRAVFDAFSEGMCPHVPLNVDPLLLLALATSSPLYFMVSTTSIFTLSPRLRPQVKSAPFSTRSTQVCVLSVPHLHVLFYALGPHAVLAAGSCRIAYLKYHFVFTTAHSESGQFNSTRSSSAHAALTTSSTTSSSRLRIPSLGSSIRHGRRRLMPH